MLSTESRLYLYGIYIPGCLSDLTFCLSENYVRFPNCFRVHKRTLLLNKSVQTRNAIVEAKKKKKKNNKMKKKKTENQTKLSFALRFVCLAFCDLFSL